MTFELDHNEIKLRVEPEWIRVITNSGDSIPLQNQSIEETQEIIVRNYRVVLNHFQQKVGDKINPLDLEKVSLKIVLQYFHMYNLWRGMYKRLKNPNIHFLEKDFDHPYTGHKIVDYFKNKYPKNYSEYCSILLGMNFEEFSEFEKRKEQFDNK